MNTINSRRIILALADDMTGALEVGAHFSAVGFDTVVVSKPVESTTAQVIAYDTETRHLSPACAAEAVKRFVDGTRPHLIYKKTDSTLRGNISTELKALSEIFPDWRIGYAPAYPVLGRTVKQGVLYVDGVPVSQTSFGSDLLNPVRASAISSVLDQQLNCTIYDGEHDCHVEEAARAILADESMRLIAGPGALSGALAGIIAEQLVPTRIRSVSLPRISSCLVMNGSLHDRSLAQIRHAEAPGWKLLETSHADNAEPAQVADANARNLLKQIASNDPEGVFVMGGDTAFAVVSALGFPTLWPIREIVPGVPIARIKAAEITRDRDLFLITKAGGFGELDVINRVHRELNLHAQ